MVRRTDREVLNVEEIEEIMRRCDSLSLALNDDEFPYIVPMNFGYSLDDGRFSLYLHCAGEGKKLELIRNNPNASFQMNCSHKLVTGENACDYSMDYESVCGHGKIFFVKDEDKLSALTLIMKHYTGNDSLPMAFNAAVLTRTTVLRIDVAEITAKRKGMH